MNNGRGRKGGDTIKVFKLLSKECNITKEEYFEILFLGVDPKELHLRIKINGELRYKNIKSELDDKEMEIEYKKYLAEKRQRDINKYMVDKK
jgi:hypothetical protein